ncbi:MAG TPA: hypothetical protein VMX55_02895 [candidate division Zixibacteria bacterium]|nr:hypothetical protein [candidate division Zixibacteria bacterium]
MDKKERQWRKKWRDEFKKAALNEWSIKKNKRHRESKNKSEEAKPYSQEELEAHPELGYEIKKSRRQSLKDRREQHFRERHLHQRIMMVKEFNKPVYTHVIEGFSIVLGALFIAFGVIGAISIFGITESNSWKIYQSTSFFGWKGNAITGIALIVVGIVILWSIPFFFFNNTQKADSYLIIGTGLGFLFGVIYVFIIMADLISSLVDSLANQITVSITTYFYYPILLALLTIPVFRILVIRHVVFTPTESKEEEITEDGFTEPDWDSITSFHDWREEFRRIWMARWEYYRKHRKRRREGRDHRKRK